MNTNIDTPITRYVVGFLFSSHLRSVVLIRKNKPAWQSGLLNGVGGKIEPTDVSSSHAMSREFVEEAGLVVPFDQWKRFCQMDGINDGGSGRFESDFFSAAGDLGKVKTTESEQVGVYDVESIHIHRPDMIEILAWLVALAVDFMNDGRPGYVRAIYP